jgi:hypothetical protein
MGLNDAARGSRVSGFSIERQIVDAALSYNPQKLRVSLQFPQERMSRRKIHRAVKKGNFVRAYELLAGSSGKPGINLPGHKGRMPMAYPIGSRKAGSELAWEFLPHGAVIDQVLIHAGPTAADLV